MTFAVRAAVSADARGLAEVHVAAWHETYGQMLDAAVIASFDVAERTTMWEGALGHGRHPEGVIVVAENVDGIVGFAVARPSRSETPARDWELVSLYTLAAVHGSGVGSALLNEAVGTRPAEVWLATENARATAFYRKHGFVEDGTTNWFDRWRIQDKRMVR